MLAWILGASTLLMAYWLAVLMRKYFIVRHLFVNFSDQTAHAMDDQVLAATLIMHELLFALGVEGPTMDDARTALPTVLSEATAGWNARATEVQKTLRANGVAPLNLIDKDGPIWAEGLIWKVSPLRRP